MARSIPSRALPTGLSGAGDYFTTIPRPDRSTLGGAPGLYPNDAPGTSVEEKVNKTYDRVGQRTRTSPLGERRSSR